MRCCIILVVTGIRGLCMCMCMGGGCYVVNLVMWSVRGGR